MPLRLGFKDKSPLSVLLSYAKLKLIGLITKYFTYFHCELRYQLKQLVMSVYHAYFFLNLKFDKLSLRLEIYLLMFFSIIKSSVKELQHCLR